MAREAVVDARVELLVAVERRRPAAPARIDVEALVVRDDDELGRLRPCVGRCRAPPCGARERRFARGRVPDLGELLREPFGERRVAARAARLAEEHLAAGAVAVRARRAEVDLAECPLPAGLRQEREVVEAASVAATRPRQPLVDLGDIVEPRSLQALERASAVAQMPGLLEPAVDMEHPVDRAHAVVGEHDRGRLLAGRGAGHLDQVRARRVDRLVDPDDLVARVVGSCAGCSGSSRCQPRWPMWSELMKSTHSRSRPGSSS